MLQEKDVAILKAKLEEELQKIKSEKEHAIRCAQEEYRNTMQVCTVLRLQISEDLTFTGPKNIVFFFFHEISNIFTGPSHF